MPSLNPHPSPNPNPNPDPNPNPNPNQVGIRLIDHITLKGGHKPLRVYADDRSNLWLKVNPRLVEIYGAEVTAKPKPEPLTLTPTLTLTLNPNPNPNPHPKP